jgi:hypothetical protein
VGLMRDLFGPSKEEIWSQLAAQIGGEFTAGGWFGTDVVQARVGDWILTLDTYTVSTGKSSVTYTRFRAPFANKDGFTFVINRAGPLTPVGKFFGMQDLEIGEPVFDGAFVIQSNNPGKVGAMLANARIRELLQAQPRVGFQVQDDQGWFGPSFPEGVDQLYFQVHGTMRDLGELRGLYDLFSDVLNTLCHLDSAYKDDVDQHIEALRRPGGKIQSGSLVLWDGDLARDRAALALGEARNDPRAMRALLEALPGAPPQLRNGILYSLGSIGLPEAVPYLIPYLGGSPDAPGRSGFTGATTAVAIRSLGEGAIVDTFSAACAGDASALDRLKPEWQSGFVNAFRSALRSRDGREVASAAAALQAWAAVEALQEIRDAQRRFKNDPVVGAQLEAVVRELEKRSSLPRTSQAPLMAGDQLPVPAGSPEAAPEGLPRPSTEPKG